ncbi:MAG: pyridoxamine 5'-phosphate oxidase family protein [Actinomycetes bacterium]
MNAVQTAAQVLQDARTILTNGSDLCFLMTQHAPGRINSRVMQPFGPDSDMVLWFGTGPDTRKVRDIRSYPHATVGYQSADGGAYVSMSGSASVVDDAVQRAGLWRSDWTQFFPGGPEHGYILLKFVPDRIEVLDLMSSFVPEPFVVQAAAVVRIDDDWVLERDA